MLSFRIHDGSRADLDFNFFIGFGANIDIYFSFGSRYGAKTWTHDRFRADMDRNFIMDWDLEQSRSKPIYAPLSSLAAITL